MSGISLDSAKDAKQEAQSGNLRDNEAGIPEDQAYDYEEYDAPIVKGHPECLITFDRIVGLNVFNTRDGFLEFQNNLELGGNQGYGNDLVLTIESPELVEGELWNEDNDFRDLRVLGDPSSDFSPYELRKDVDESGDTPEVIYKGVDLGMGKFDGDRVEGDGFDSQYIQLFISSSRAADVLGQLDTAGKWAHTQEGDFTEGIIEAPPKLGDDGYDASDHGAPRAIGYPELRADMVDQQGAIAWTFADDEPTTQSRVDVNVFTIEDGNLVGLAPLGPDDEAYALPEYPRGGNLYYDHDGTPEDVGADTEPENAGGVADASEMIDGTDNDTSSAELAYQDLPDAAQQFVDDAVAAVNSKGYDTVEDFDDWDERFATGTADIDFDLDQTNITEIINARL